MIQSISSFRDDGARPRLKSRDIAVLRRLARLGGGRAITLPRELHGAAIKLWHREIVEIWYMQKNDDAPSLRGPFFSLTISGMMLASSFMRDDVVAPVQHARRRIRMPRIRNYDPSEGGQDFQGDVSITRIPADIAISTIDEIAPQTGRLIVAAGEATGHHHAIYLLANVPKFHDEGLARALTAEARQRPPGTARLYRDPTVAPEMVRRGILTRSDLAIACLVVEGGPVVIAHEEHDGIRVQPGRYLVGGQIESVGAEERRVLD